MMKRVLAVLLCLGIAFLPVMSQAGAGRKIPGFERSFLPPLPKPKLANGTRVNPPALTLTVAPKIKPAAASVAVTSLGSPPSGTLPVALMDSSGQIVLGQGISSISVNSNQNKMVVTQNAPQAIQNWSSFNIGSNAEVDFSQKSSSWVVLNRIYDLNPSQIFGKIAAKGEVYLINQNGILFGQGSQVNVHTLIGSSLNISNSDFMNGAAQLPGWGLHNRYRQPSPQRFRHKPGDHYHRYPWLGFPAGAQCRKRWDHSDADRSDRSGGGERISGLVHDTDSRHNTDRAGRGRPADRRRCGQQRRNDGQTGLIGMYGDKCRPKWRDHRRNRAQGKWTDRTHGVGQCHHRRRQHHQHTHIHFNGDSRPIFCFSWRNDQHRWPKSLKSIESDNSATQIVNRDSSRPHRALSI